MLSRRKKNKNIVFVVSCNIGFDLRLTIKRCKTQIGTGLGFWFSILLDLNK